MLKLIKLAIHRIKDHWQTTLAAVLVLVGYLWFHAGKIDFADFKEYLILIPTLIFLFMRDWKKPDVV